MPGRLWYRFWAAERRGQRATPQEAGHRACFHHLRRVVQKGRIIWSKTIGKGTDFRGEED